MNETRKKIARIKKLAVSDRGAARRLGVCPRTVFDLRKTGQLGYVRIGARVVIPLSEIERFLRENTVREEG